MPEDIGTGVVAVVDDDEAVRLSTCALLRGSGHMARGFSSGDALIADFPIAASAILLDVRMPGTDGIGVLEYIRQREWRGPVVMLSGHGDIALAVQAMQLGAVDFLEKPYVAEDLLERVARAIEGSGKPALDARDEEKARLVAALSPRQLDVLKGIANGLPNKLIAHRLGLSTRTVEAYRAQVMERLAVRSTAEVVKLALASGISTET